ncbi:MAG: site-specific integrase [Myxococcales bacterium]|nr:site-specific integrase [Myxococcales bacterium]
MSVRREKRRDPKTGKARQFWMIDVDYKHPSGRRQRVRKVAPVQTRREAERYEHQLRRELADGSYGESEVAVPTLEAFAREFLIYAGANNKPSGVAAKEGALRVHLVPALGRHALHKITEKELEYFKADKLRAGLSPKTINNLLSILRQLLVVATEWGFIANVPRVRWLKVPKPIFDFLDFEEASRLVEGASAEPEWQTMIWLALKTGLRLGELRALQWDDVDLVAGRLVVRHSAWKQHLGTPKNGRTREAPLSAQTVKRLRAHRHLRGDFVFCRMDGAMLTKEQCKWPLWRACKRAGLRRVGWHPLRHTFASHLVMRGVPLKAVQELMGHSTIEMTMRYSHLSPDVRSDAVALLDDPSGNMAATQPHPTVKSLKL